jgi:two-component system, LuxR family, response regulator FixJ
VSRSKTLYIIDQDGRTARSLATLLSSQDLRVEIRSDGEDLLANLDVDRAACVLIERHAPGMSAAELLAQLRVRGVAIPVIQLDAVAAVGLSAEDVADPRGPTRRVETGAGTPSAALPATEVLKERFERLTSREREIAQLVAQGHSSKDLARTLKLSKSTVDNHRARILEKLELENFVQVSRFLSLLASDR